MMCQAITSRDVEMTSPSFPAESASSQLKEIEIDELEELYLKSWKEQEPLFTSPLSEIMKIETLTSRDQSYEFETETVLTEEFYKGARQIQCLIKISKMIDKITREERLFEGVGKHELLKAISEMLSETSLELSEISDEELYERIERILALEAMSGLLRDLDPEQIEIFDEAVKRRSLFK